MDGNRKIDAKAQVLNFFRKLFYSDHMYQGISPKVYKFGAGFFLIGTLTLFFSAQRLAAQDYTFESAGVVFSDSTQTFDVFFKVLDNGIPIKLKSKDIKAFEIIDQENEMTNYPPLYRDSFVTDSGVKDTISALILADLGSLDEAGAQQARQLAEQAYQLFSGQANTQVWFSTFGSEVGPAQLMTSESKDSLLAKIQTGDRSSDLYRSVFQHVRDMKKTGGKKVLILLSGGVNSYLSNSEYYQTRLPYDTSDVFRLVSSLDYSFSLFPVAIGSKKDEGFLKQLAVHSPAPSDAYSDAALPKGLESFVGKSEVLHSNNVIRLFPVDRVQRGRTRTLKLVWGVTGKEVNVSFKEAGSPNNPQPLARTGSAVANFFQQLLIAIGLVGGMLALFQFAVPGVERQRFRKKYVVKYKQEGNVSKRDPLTNEPFQAGESVVVKCRQMCSVSTWEGIGGQCPNYPDCLDFNDPCDGAGAPTVDKKFFSMKGIFRQLNWLWFGLLGGFIGWLLFAVFKLLNFTWYYKLYTNIANQIGLAETSAGGGLANFDSMADDTVLGIAFGAGLCFALAWVEERGQPRQLSWGRIMLRTALGTVVSAMVFLLGFSIQFGGLVENPLFSGLITWALFGVAIGIVLSVGSSIAISRAVLGGLIAAVIAYLAYYGLSFLTTDFGLARLIGFVLMGGILGAMLNTVISALEDFELEYLSPSQYRGTNPISKWLKAGLEITVGKEPGSYVYVKWDDESVEPRHAKLSFFNGVVYIEPLAETLRKGFMLPMNKKTPLKNGDIIQLGRASITKFKYVEKRKTQETPA